MQKHVIAFFFLLAICFTSFLTGQRMKSNPESQVNRAMDLIMARRQVVFDYQLFAKTEAEAAPAESMNDLIKKDVLKKEKHGR
ncbi:MAG: hypothetical protein PHW04_18045 [Candidatus Wallbacteria bacterium]|nr:hypothetical protein [Candidatus Wallbacteria bacterium]